MKKIILSLVAMVIATVSFAQGSLLATLSHEGTVQTFYGVEALKSAHAAATHGDVITLSAGSFSSVNITKAITLRGSGMSTDSVTNREPTILINDFDVNIADSVSERLTVEGIFHNARMYFRTGSVKSPMFLKCRFKNIDSSSNTVKNASFIHCKVAGDLYMSSGCTATCLNSVIRNPRNYANSNTTAIEFINCVILCTSNMTNYLGDIGHSSFKNCFISTIYKTNSAQINSSCSAFNNVGINTSDPNYLNQYIFINIPNQSNKTVTALNEVMKTFNDMSTWNDDETFELTDAAKKKFIGTDGTEIGIYGGNLPFDPTPSNPQITKCQVASKSTADGKLSVDITIKAAE